MTQAIITMIPEAWQNDANMSASKKAYYRWNAYSMEPWDGPGLSACLCLSASLSLCLSVSISVIVQVWLSVWDAAK